MNAFVFLFVLILQLQNSFGDNTLKVFTKKKDYLHACFYKGSTWSGGKKAVCVKSRPNFVEVTKNWRVLFRQEKNSRFTFQQIREKTFVKYDGPKMNKMFVAENIEGMRQGYGPSMREANANEFHETVKSLIRSHDVQLLEEMAQALGNQGIFGNVYPSAVPFYTMAHRLSTISQTLLDPSQYASKKKGFLQDVVLSKRSDSQCPPNQDNECLGMCGRSCSCWKFVCGDCCWHKGCYEHDMCCRRDFYSYACFNVIGISCDKGFPKYPDCLA